MTTPIGSSDGEREALPPLPKPYTTVELPFIDEPVYTADQMRAYARAALSSTPQAETTEQVWQRGYMAGRASMSPHAWPEGMFMTADEVAAEVAAQNNSPAALSSDREMAPEAKADVSYPRDFFSALIEENSPYAFYIFQWVPYQTDAKRWRLKMQHDVRAFDGREAFNIWPNGSSCGPFRDDEVEFIRISKSQFGEEWKDLRPPVASSAHIAQRSGE